MKNYEDSCTFIVSKEQEATKADIVNELKNSGAEMLLNYLPVGSERQSVFMPNVLLRQVWLL